MDACTIDLLLSVCSRAYAFKYREQQLVQLVAFAALTAMASGIAYYSILLHKKPLLPAVKGEHQRILRVFCFWWGPALLVPGKNRFCERSSYHLASSGEPSTHIPESRHPRQNGSITTKIVAATNPRRKELCGSRQQPAASFLTCQSIPFLVAGCQNCEELGERERERDREGNT